MKTTLKLFLTSLLAFAVSCQASPEKKADVNGEAVKGGENEALNTAKAKLKAGNESTAKNNALKPCGLPSGEAKAEEWVSASNALGLALLKPFKRNIAVSAYSAERAFGMVLEGACGETFDEMQAALKMPQANNLSQLGHQMTDQMLSNLSQSQLEVDNRIWYHETLPLEQSYNDAVKANYGVSIERVNFVKDTQKILRTINETVNKATHGKIPVILDSLNPKTRIALTNALYFKSDWEKAFKESATKEEPFYAASGEVKTKMMHMTHKIPARETDSYVMFGLPMKDDFVFVGWLPKLAEGEKGDAALERLKNSLPDDAIDQIQAMRMKKVILTMPKWKVESSLDLKPLMTQLGMTSVWTGPNDGSPLRFDRLTGDLSKVNIAAEDKIVLGDAVQRTYVSIDEKGAEAAAATAIAMRKMAAPIEREKSLTITLDHPFLYSIVYMPSRLALFTGQYMEPPKEKD